MKTPKEEIEELRRQIREHDYNYYVLHNLHFRLRV